MLRFFSTKRNLYFFLLLLIGLVAVLDFRYLGLERRTFVFYSALEGATIVEDRMLRGSASLETDIRRYAEEVLLGPVSPEAAPLFSRETRLNSLFFRDGEVYADFSESALLAASMQTGPYFSFLTLNEGIRRNFPAVSDVKFFIGGRQIFFKEFNWISTDSADNFSKTGQ